MFINKRKTAIIRYSEKEKNNLNFVFLFAVENKWFAH